MMIISKWRMMLNVCGRVVCSALNNIAASNIFQFFILIMWRISSKLGSCFWPLWALIGKHTLACITQNTSWLLICVIYFAPEHFFKIFEKEMFMRTQLNEKLSFKYFVNLCFALMGSILSWKVIESILVGSLSCLSISRLLHQSPQENKRLLVAMIHLLSSLLP